MTAVDDPATTGAPADDDVEALARKFIALNNRRARGTDPEVAAVEAVRAPAPPAAARQHNGTPLRAAPFIARLIGSLDRTRLPPIRRDRTPNTAPAMTPAATPIPLPPTAAASGSDADDKEPTISTTPTTAPPLPDKAMAFASFPEQIFEPEFIEPVPMPAEPPPAPIAAEPDPAVALAATLPAPPPLIEAEAQVSPTASALPIVAHEPVAARPLPLRAVRDDFGARPLEPDPPILEASEAYERQDYAAAFVLWSKAAAAENREAQFRLGQLYTSGQGVVGNSPDAVYWYRRAAEQGHAEAQYQLSLFYQYGRADNGPYTMGEWYRAASVNDKATADRDLALLFPNGLGIERNEAEALRWALAAAEQGMPAAQASAAIFYSRGMACDVDYQKARYWYELAACNSHAEGEFGLGVLYANGYGVATDLAAAAEHYRKAAKNDHDGAQLALGLMYLAGTGVDA